MGARGAVARVTSTLTLKLNFPKDSDSPGWVKTRRKRVPDRLVQKRIQLFNSKCSSEEFIQSGGPLELKTYRGIKRVMGDQVEGPSRKTKKTRND